MFLVMGAYGAVASVIGICVFIFGGAYIIGEGYGDGDKSQLAGGLFLIVLGLGQIVLFGMAIWDWFAPVAR